MLGRKALVNCAGAVESETPDTFTSVVNAFESVTQHNVITVYGGYLARS